MLVDQTNFLQICGLSRMTGTMGLEAQTIAPPPVSLQRLLLAIHNDSKNAIPRSGAGVRVRDQKTIERITNFERKVKLSFEAVAGTFTRHEAKFREVDVCRFKVLMAGSRRWPR